MPYFSKRPVLVTWRDTTTRHSGWESVERAQTLIPSEVKTVGFVIRDTKTELLLVQSVADDDETMGVIAIPRGWVKKVERL